MEENKTPRKRVANFTSDEKALLAQLIKKKPIIESKLTDGKSIAKKKTAWSLVTDEFNSNAHVHKRDTLTLKRAWDNLKAMARKTRATERGNLIKTGGGPSTPPHPPQHGAIINMVEEAAPVMICEIKNSFDSDGTVLSSINKESIDITLDTVEDEIEKSCSIDLFEIRELGDSQMTQTDNDFCSEEIKVCDDIIEISATSKSAHNLQAEQRKPSDYVRREGVLRIKHFETKKKIELQILKAKLRAADMEEERNKNLLEISKLELAELKKRLALKD